MLAGLRVEPCDAAYQVLRSSSPALRSRRTLRPLWPRTRGWFHPPGLLTSRQRLLVERAGRFQRAYADFLANSGFVREAVPRYRCALANPYLDPEDRDGTANNCALALEKSGDRNGALALYMRLAGNSTLRAEVYLNAGNLLAGMNRMEDAAEMYRRALAVAEPGSGYWRYAGARLGSLNRRGPKQRGR